MTSSHPALLIRRFDVEEIKWETVSVYTLVLRPAVGEEMPTFIAGQWMYLHILDAKGNSKGRAAFSVASAPEESKQVMEFAIKIQGGFTQALSRYQPGDVVGVQGPFGVFTLHEGVTPLVMFAGGIGITPFRSMIRSLVAQKKTSEVYLFYSNKSIEETAYFDEVHRLAQAHAWFHPIFNFTVDLPPQWEASGRVGRLTMDDIVAHYSDFSHGEFLMCGPDGFMDAIQGMLEGQGVTDKKRLRRESFG